MFNYCDDRMLSAMKQRIFVNDVTGETHARTIYKSQYKILNGFND